MGRVGWVSKDLEDSLLVKILFQADYRMKQIGGGASPSRAPGFKSQVDLFREMEIAPSDAPVLSRLWLAPESPAAASIWSVRSEAGGLNLFDAQVRVFPEAMRLLRGSYESTGGRHPIHELSALHLTNAYPQLEREFPEFKRLRQAFELCRMSALLALGGPDHAPSGVLASLSELPIPRQNYDRSGFELVSSSVKRIIGGKSYTVRDAYRVGSTAPSCS